VIDWDFVLPIQLCSHQELCVDLLIASYHATRDAVAAMAVHRCILPAASRFSAFSNCQGLFRAVVAGVTTLGHFTSAVSELTQEDSCRRWFDHTEWKMILASPADTMRVLTMWHRGGVLWSRCIVRTLTRVCSRRGAQHIAEFVCGCCECDHCSCQRKMLHVESVAGQDLERPILLAETCGLAEAAIEDCSHVENAVPFDASDGVVEDVKWAQRVDRNILAGAHLPTLTASIDNSACEGSASRLVALLTFSRSSPELGEALSKTSAALVATMHGVDIKPPWAHGATILVPELSTADLEPPFLDPSAIMPRHVVLFEDDVDEVLEDLSDKLAYSFRKLKPSRNLPILADELSLLDASSWVASIEEEVTSSDSALAGEDESKQILEVIVHSTFFDLSHASCDVRRSRSADSRFAS